MLLPGRLYQFSNKLGVNLPLRRKVWHGNFSSLLELA